ncbi:MAG: low molecular weight protein-tyrosine-phosphatase [Bacteroidota bacterium]
MSNTNTPYRILAVCLGNICRSPLAEGLLRQEAEKRGLPWEVDSAGTSGWHEGEAADPRSRAVARHNGLNIDDQRSRKVKAEDFENFDLILAMDRQNMLDLSKRNNFSDFRRSEHPGKSAASELAADIEGGKAHAAEILQLSGISWKHGPDVIDPYHDDDGFQSVFDILQEAASKLADLYEAGKLPNQ